MYARVFGPKFPEAGEIPTDFCHLAKAAFVAVPNLVVSFPRDPAPVEVTGNPCVFRYICRAFASEPVEPNCMSRLKLAFAPALAYAFALGGDAPPPLSAAICACRALSCAKSCAEEDILLLAGAGGAAGTKLPPPPPPLEITGPFPPLELLLDEDESANGAAATIALAPLHVPEGVIVIVSEIAADESNLISDCEAPQLSVVTEPARSPLTVNDFLSADTTSIEEPGMRMTTKLLSPTVIWESVAPDTVYEEPPMLNVAVSSTSLKAAKANTGRNNAVIEPERRNFFMGFMS